MLAGRWEINGESISFDEQGRLRNGQHRLSAQVEAGVTLELVIVTDVPYTTNTWDRGKNRTDSDVARLRNIDTNSVINAAAGLVYYEAGKKTIMQNEKLDLIARDLEVWKKMYTCIYHGQSQAIMKKGGCLAALFMAFNNGVINEKSADAFCQMVNTGTTVEGYISDAPLVLRRTLMNGIKIENATTKGGGKYLKACLEVTARAIEDFAGCKHPKQNYKATGRASEICKEFMSSRSAKQVSVAV